jgi:type I restriction enzyme S subunit
VVDELIARLCPNGVEFKLLGEIGSLYGGLTGKTKADFVDGNAQFVTYVDVCSNPVMSSIPTHLVSVGAGERQNMLRYGDVLFTASSETLDEVGMSSAVTLQSSRPLYLNSFCFGFRPFDGVELDPEFSKYLFRAESMRRQIVQTANGVTRFNISKSRFRAISVPLPPLKVQMEIAGVLDRFSRLEAELGADLGAELNARQRQYEYYRDALITFDTHDGVRWVPMGAVGEFIRGRRFTKKDIVPAGLGSIHYGEIYTRYGAFANEALSHVRRELEPNLRFAKTGDVVIAAVGETVDDVGKAVAWLGKDDVAIHDDCFAYRHSHNPKFVSYYFQTGVFRTEKAKHVARAKVKRLSGESLAKLRIPLLPMDEQERIVNILDRFDALVTDLSTSVPAEAAARRRQYEHYRDRLLTFKPAAR